MGPSSVTSGGEASAYVGYDDAGASAVLDVVPVPRPATVVILRHPRSSYLRLHEEQAR